MTTPPTAATPTASRRKAFPPPLLLLLLLLLGAAATPHSSATAFLVPALPRKAATAASFVLPPLHSTPWGANGGEGDDDDDGRPFATRGRTVDRAPASSSSSSSSSSSPFAGLNVDLESFDLQGLSARLQESLGSLGSLDADALASNLRAAYDNFASGNLGERGEVYFAAQAAVLLCVLGGGVPVLGDPLFLLLGPVLLVGGLGVAALALTGLGDALSPWPVPAGDGKGALVTDGMFAYVRHPSYAGLLAACAGLSIATDSADRLLLTALLWYVLDLKSDYEEAELAKAYGTEAYDAYRRQVPQKFVPQAWIDLLPWNKDKAE